MTKQVDLVIDKRLMAKRAEEAETFLKRLANSNRLLILCALLDKELSVSELNQEIYLSQSALSQHLSVLREANFVKTRRESQVIYYALADCRVKAILLDLYQLFCVK